MKKTAILVITIVLVLGAIFILESRKSDNGSLLQDAKSISIMTKGEKAKVYEGAKEISSPDAFINTGLNSDGSVKPITIQELIGKKVILVDFWTYSCINCQRTLPYLNEWYEKYTDDGLVILGIHTPEFEFEKDLANVQKAVDKYGIKYPVILDNDYSTWRAYKNRYWPRKYLIDVDGYIVYDHIGEGGYEETEMKIVEALSELNGRRIELDKGSVTEKDEVDFSQVKSPESYLGSSRIEYLNNLPSQSCLAGACEYHLPANTPLNTFSLSGKWRIEDERAVLESETGSIIYHFSANKVNLVAGGISGDVKAEIYLDGEKISANFEGADVSNGVVTFMDHDLYNLVDLRGNYSKHIVEIKFLESGVETFAFTFG